MKLLGTIGSFGGLVAVTLGAFGAHGLEGKLGPEKQGWWETATLYLLIHTPVILHCAATPSRHKAAWAFLFGAFIFAGTLYAMALGGPRLLGAITPIGGLGLIIGWGLLAMTYIRE